MYSRAQRWTVLLATLALVATVPLAGASPTAKPEDVVDVRFIKELDDSGYIDGLYKAKAK